MKIKTITYQRVKNLGNNESERLEMSAEVGEDEDAIIEADALRLTVTNMSRMPVEWESERKLRIALLNQ